MMMDGIPAELHSLLEMLTYRRPHDEPSERAFLHRFVLPLRERFDLRHVGEYGNIIIRVPRPEGGPLTTLFSCHTDTVHREGAARQRVAYNAATRMAYGPGDDVLGADDAAGVWLLLELIGAGIPGVYAFLRAEETGRRGSREIAESHPDIVRGISRAVAFDRRATSSVITHQTGVETCSPEFAGALASALNVADPGFAYQPDATGTFTDTASYIGLVPECTNVSCGYYEAHTVRERLDLAHIIRLRDALLRVDWESLPIHRTLAPAG